MSTGTSKSEDVVPDQRKGVCSLQVAKEILPSNGGAQLELLIYGSSYVPTLANGLELWVVRSQVQVVEMSFLRRMAGRCLGVCEEAWRRSTAPPH